MKKAVAMTLLTATWVGLLGYTAYEEAQADVRRVVRDVRLVEDGVTTFHPTLSTNVYDFLDHLGITIGENDVLNVSNVSSTGSDFIPHHTPRIEIERSLHVEAMVDGMLTVHNLPPGSRVGNLVAIVEGLHGDVYFHGISRGDMLYYGQRIEFFTPQSHQFSSIVPIPYNIVHTYDPTLALGDSLVIVEGEFGQAEVVTEIIMLSGIRIDSRVISNQTITEPIDHVVALGTFEYVAAPTPRRVFQVPDPNLTSFTFGPPMIMEATAYTAGYESTRKRPGDPGYGITASGMRVEHGVVAVDPNVIPLGTPLYVEGYGFAIAADVGGAIRGHSIDLFMYNLEDAIRFGRRNVTVFILTENP